MRLYSDFLAGAEGVKAYDMQDNTEKTLVEMYPKIEIDLFALVDFGLDGRLEVVLRYRNTVLFCEDGKLYAYVIPYSRMYDLRYNGLCETDDGNSGKSYVIYNFSAKDGLITQTLASEEKDEATGQQSYYIHAAYEDGRYVSTEKRRVSKGEYTAFVDPIEDAQSMSSKKFTGDNRVEQFSLYQDDLPNPTVGIRSTVGVDDGTMIANRDLIRKYREFLGSNRAVLDVQSGETGSLKELESLKNIIIRDIALVDFGMDGVLETVIITRDSTGAVPVLFYEDGELYIDYVDNRQMQQLTCEGLCKNSDGGVDILTFSAGAGCQRRTVVSASADPDTGEKKYFAHIDLTDGKYAPAEVKEITQAQLDTFWESRCYPVYCNYENRHELLRLAYPPTPAESIRDANRDVLQVYYDFVNGIGSAIDVEGGEYTVFDYVIRHGINPIVKFTLVDFGGDGVLEMVLEDARNHFYTVLYYANDRLYTASVTHRGLIGHTYTGIAYGSGGTSGRDYVLSFTPEKGLVEQNIASHGLDDVFEERYYLYATYKDGRYIPSEKVEVTQDEYIAFLRDEVPAQWAKFNDDTLRRVLKIEPSQPPAPVQPEPDDSDTVVLTVGGREITKAYAASLIEELEEWCNCRPFYSFDFADASQLTDDDLMRAYMVLMTPMEPVEHTQDRVAAELDKWFKGYSFDITRCTSVPAADEDPMPYGWQDLDIRVTDISAEGNVLTFRATLKEGWEKEYAIEFYEDGYYILKAQEILSPADRSKLNTEAMQAYYDFITGKRDALHTSNLYSRSMDYLDEYYTDIVGFSFADFGSDGVLEMVMRCERSTSQPFVLYWVDGELYIGLMAGTADLEMKANGFCMYDADYMIDLRYYYLEQFSPAEYKYQLMLACETQPSKDDTDLARYRIFYDLVNGEYVQRPCEATKSELKDFLQTYFDAPNIEWHDYADVLGHEFFKDVER